MVQNEVLYLFPEIVALILLSSFLGDRDQRLRDGHGRIWSLLLQQSELTTFPNLIFHSPRNIVRK